MSNTFSAPSFVYNEIDQSQFSLESNIYAGAVVFGAPQGPITPTLISSQQQLRSNYGTVDSTWGYGLITADEAVQSTPVLCLRVVDPLTSRYGMMTVVNSSLSPESTITTIVANPNGAQNSYLTPDTAVVVSYYKSNFSTTQDPYSAQGVTVTFNDIGLTVPTAGLTQLKAFQAVNNALSNYMLTQYEIEDPAYTLTGASAVSVVPAFVNPTQNTDYMAVLFLNEGISELNAGQAVWTPNLGNDTWQFSDSWLFHIYALNPGDWINGQYACSISNVSAGKPQIDELAFSAVLTTGAVVSFSITINNTTYDINQPYSVSSDDTLAALCEAIIGTVNGMNAVVKPINGQTANFTTIALSGPSNTYAVTYSNLKVTGMTTNPTIVDTIISAAVAGNGQFNLNVYSTSNTAAPIETFLCTLYHVLDGYGYQMFVESVVNTGTSSTSASKYIRVVANTALTQGTIINQTVGLATPVNFAGGNDGDLPDNAQIAAGWAVLQDRTAYDFWFAMTGGYNNATVLTAVTDLANIRADCVGIVDVPTSAFGSEGTWMESVPLDTAYTATFSPYILKAIVDTGTQEYVPPSGAVVHAITLSAASNTVFVAAAGAIRGILTNAIGVYGNYDAAGLSLCAANTITPIVKNKTGGYKINDVLTNQTYASLLSYLPVRLGFIYIHRAIEQACAPFEFDNITTNEMYQIQQTLAILLKPLVDAELLQNAGVQCDIFNNPENTAITGTLNINVWGTGVAPIRNIVVDAYITASDSSYTDYVV